MVVCLKMQWYKVRGRQSNASKKQWQNAEIREKMIKLKVKKHKSLEHREKMSEITKKNWKNSTYREKVIKSMRETWSNPENLDKRRKIQASGKYKAKISKKSKKYWSDPKIRVEQTEMMVRLWGDSNYRKKVRNGFKIDNKLGHCVRSSWESIVCHFLKNNDIKYTMEPFGFEYELNGKKKGYYVDLEINKEYENKLLKIFNSMGVEYPRYDNRPLYIEIKGWWDELSKIKCQLFEKEHRLMIIDGNNIKQFVMESVKK